MSFVPTCALRVAFCYPAAAPTYTTVTSMWAGSCSHKYSADTSAATAYKPPYCFSSVPNFHTFSGIFRQRWRRYNRTAAVTLPFLATADFLRVCQASFHHLLFPTRRILLCSRTGSILRKGEHPQSNAHQLIHSWNLRSAIKPFSCSTAFLPTFASRHSAMRTVAINTFRVKETLSSLLYACGPSWTARD